MRRKIALLTAGTIAGATLSMGTAAPAQAQICTSTDPVLAYACHLYQHVGETATAVYCKLNPPCR